MLPQDDYILLSLVNTKLRDGASLEDFCAQYCVEAQEIIDRLYKSGYRYDEEKNTFTGA